MTIAREVLDVDGVVLGLPTVERDAAIDRVGELLIGRGVVDGTYIDSMKKREATVSTYLGNGIALPHGTYEDKDAIKGTAVVVTQYPDGVDWNGETARLVIGLAAQGDDHLQVIAQLARVLEDEDLCRVLWTTDDAAFLVETLTTADEEE